MHYTNSTTAKQVTSNTLVTSGSRWIDRRSGDFVEPRLKRPCHQMPDSMYEGLPAHRRILDPADRDMAPVHHGQLSTEYPSTSPLDEKDGSSHKPGCDCRCMSCVKTTNKDRCLWAESYHFVSYGTLFEPAAL